MTHLKMPLLGAALIAAATLACQDDPLDPGSDTGRLAVRVTFQTPPSATARTGTAGDPAARGTVGLLDSADAPEAGMRRSVGTGRIDQNARADARLDAQGAATAMPGLDAVRVRLTGAGIDSTFDLAQTQQGFEGTVTELPVGLYTVTVVGSETELVTWVGTTSGVRVNAGETANATVNLVSFVPTVAPFETPTTNMTAVVAFTSVPGATRYAIEIDGDPDFPDPTVLETTNTTEPLTASDVGTFYVRVRAGNDAIEPSAAYPSDPQAIEILADTFAGDSEATATALGLGGGANGGYEGLNITPGEEDWFELELFAGQALTVSVLAGVLGVPSDLNPVLTILDDALNVVAENDDVSGEDLDARVAFYGVPATGRYLVRVTGFEMTSVGHYELHVAATTPTFVSAGTRHTCGITTDREAYCWGRGNRGALGAGADPANFGPVLVAGDNAFETISSGTGFTCGVTEFFQVYCWGQGNTGQLGDDGFADSPVPVIAGDGLDFVQVSTGFNHTCAVSLSGEAYCWGSNGRGQIGDGGGSGAVGAPTPIGGETRVQSVAAGGRHSCAVTTAGELYCWGANEYGQLGTGLLGADEPAPVAVTGGAASDAVYRAVAGGAFHTCALTITDEAHCWGKGVDGQLGAGEFADSDVPVVVAGNLRFATIGAGLDMTCAATMTEEGYCWGGNFFGQLGDGTTLVRTLPTPVAGGLGFLTVDAGGAHSCGRSTDGATYCWGDNQYGQVGDGATINVAPRALTVAATLIELTAGNGHTCALNAAGGAFCWGSGDAGQIGNGAFDDATSPAPVSGSVSFTTIAAGALHTCGISSLDDTAFCWGDNRWGQIGVSASEVETSPAGVFGANQYSDLDVGEFHTCAVDLLADAYCWGDNRYGQLGDGTTTSSNIPVMVSGDLKFTSVAGGSDHSCGVATDETVYCWGRGDGGQLGDGAFTTSTVPVGVSGGLSFSSVVAAGGHSCGLTTDETAYCWGRNVEGQLGDNTSAASGAPVAVSGDLRFTALDADTYHTCGIASTGETYCWGWNWRGQLGDGTFVSRASPTPVLAGGPSGPAIATGAAHTCGLDESGALCWGNNTEGQLGLGETSRALAPKEVIGGLIFRAPDR